MPKNQEKDKKLLENIIEASKNARNIFFIYLTFLFYSVLTITTISGEKIIKKENLSLPILNGSVSIDAFYVVAPIIALGLFLYLQIYLQKIKEIIEKYNPTNDKTKRDDLYPWLIIFSNDELEAKKIGDRLFIIYRNSISHFILWLLLPSVILIFILQSLKLHKFELFWWLSHIMLPVVLLIVGSFWWYYNNKVSYPRIFNRKKIKKFIVFLFKEFFNKSMIHFLILFFFLELDIILISNIFPSVSNGDLYFQARNNENLSKFNKKFIDFMRIDLIGLNIKDFYYPKAELMGANIELSEFENTNLSFSNLSYSDLNRAYFKKVNLSGANLSGVNLEGAHLENINLSGANLLGVNLETAHLENINLSGTNLPGANLSFKNLEGVNLKGANLFEANLEATDLFRANLSDAILIRADLTKANLEDAILIGANLENASLKGANLSGANLKDANLIGANLEHCILKDTNFDGANLLGANLKRAHLENTNLEGAILDNND
jgi:uncharacterized protein YjbI with pentapeptide repeats